MALPLRPLLKRSFFELMRLAQAGERAAHDAASRGLCAVLCLHRVSPHANPFYAPLHPDTFDDLIRFLTQRCNVVSLDELDQPRPRDGRLTVALTFDDGYRDFIDHARPILDHYRVKVTQNIIVSCVESGAPPWTIQLADFLHAAPASLLRELDVPGFSMPAPSTDHQKAVYGARLSYHLKMRPTAERGELVAGIQRHIARLGSFAATAMMNLADVRSLAGAHHVGCHSYSHESMGHESLAFFSDDLARCQRFFDEQLGLPLDTYAFPNGSFRGEQVRALTQQGVRHVLLVEERLARPPGPVWPRISITAESHAEARLQAVGFRANAPP